MRRPIQASLEVPAVKSGYIALELIRSPLLLIIPLLHIIADDGHKCGGKCPRQRKSPAPTTAGHGDCARRGFLRRLLANALRQL